MRILFIWGLLSALLPWVILAEKYILRAQRMAKRLTWSPYSGMLNPKSRIESYVLRSSAHRKPF